MVKLSELLDELGRVTGPIESLLQEHIFAALNISIDSSNRKNFRIYEGLGDLADGLNRWAERSADNDNAFCLFDEKILEGLHDISFAVVINFPDQDWRTLKQKFTDTRQALGERRALALRRFGANAILEDIEAGRVSFVGHVPEFEKRSHIEAFFDILFKNELHKQPERFIPWLSFLAETAYRFAAPFKNDWNLSPIWKFVSAIGATSSFEERNKLVQTAFDGSTELIELSVIIGSCNVSSISKALYGDSVERRRIAIVILAMLAANGHDRAVRTLNTFIKRAPASFFKEPDGQKTPLGFKWFIERARAQTLRVDVLAVISLVAPRTRFGPLLSGPFLAGLGRSLNHPILMGVASDLIATARIKDIPLDRSSWSSMFTAAQSELEFPSVRCSLKILLRGGVRVNPELIAQEIREESISLHEAADYMSEMHLKDLISFKDDSKTLPAALLVLFIRLRVIVRNRRQGITDTKQEYESGETIRLAESCVDSTDLSSRLISSAILFLAGAGSMLGTKGRR